jgi:peptidoglycan/LPS O-acetylase OafA/YrhL
LGTFEVTRNPALDGLRGLAALLVLIYHCGVPGLSVGYFGVDIFFVLSGFVITSLLADEIHRTEMISLRHFYVARMLRLYPALVIFLAAYLLVSPYRWPENPNPLKDVMLAGLYLSDINLPLSYLGHMWSLAVEWHYYLVWPFILLLVIRGRPWRTQVVMLSSLYLMATAWRFLRLLHFDFYDVFAAFDTRLSGLVLGGLTAIVALKYRDKVGLALLAPWCLAVLAIPFLLADRGRLSLGIPLMVVELATAGLILALLEGKGAIYRTLSSTPLVYTGMISYAIYLWHALFVSALPQDTSWYWRVPIVLALSYAVSTASWFIIEAPAMSLRHRLRAAGPAPQPT